MAARVALKTAPSSAAATSPFAKLTSRCSASGGSSSSITPHRPSNTFLPRKPAIRPPITLNGIKSNFTPRNVYPASSRVTEGQHDEGSSVADDRREPEGPSDLGGGSWRDVLK